MRCLALLFFFISSFCLPSSSFASKVHKAHEIHKTLKDIDSRVKLQLKLSSILDLEYLKKKSNQELKFILETYKSQHEVALHQPAFWRVFVSYGFIVLLLQHYDNDFERYLPESDEGKSKEFHRVLNLIEYCQENLEDMSSGDGMILASATGRDHISDQISEAKRYKEAFRRKYGHLDQESYYNILQPFVVKGTVVTVVSFCIYSFGKWYFGARKPLPQKAMESPKEGTAPKSPRRPRTKTSDTPQHPPSTIGNQEQRDIPPTKEESEKRECAKVCQKAIKNINHILTTQDKSVDEYGADFSTICDEITNLVEKVPRKHVDQKTLKTLNAVKDRIDTVAKDGKNLLYEDVLHFYVESLESYSEET